MTDLSPLKLNMHRKSYFYNAFMIYSRFKFRSWSASTGIKEKENKRLEAFSRAPNFKELSIVIGGIIELTKSL